MQVNDSKEVFAWGSDRHGQLGLGTRQGNRCYSIPRFCSFNVTIHHISCGEEHSAFIANDNLVFTMGSNNDGRLGIGDRSIRSSSTPCLVEALFMGKPVSLSCGWGHTAVVMDNGDLYTWGVGEFGALGVRDLESQWFPVKVNFPNEYGKVHVNSVSCGTRHMALIDERGKVYVCGSGEAGQLGTGSKDTEVVPTLLRSIQDKARQIACGIYHTLVLTNGGKILAMGGNNFGQLGNGSKRSSMSPVPINDLHHKNITKVAAGNHSAAITGILAFYKLLIDSGELYVWGSGTFGEFVIPQKVISIRSPVFDVEIGGNFGAALDSNGILYTWGQNNGGELGVGDYESRPSPTPVVSLQGKTITQISCGGTFTIALGRTIKTPDSIRSPRRLAESDNNKTGVIGRDQPHEDIMRHPGAGLSRIYQPAGSNIAPIGRQHESATSLLEAELKRTIKNVREHTPDPYNPSSGTQQLQEDVSDNYMRRPRPEHARSVSPIAANYLTQPQKAAANILKREEPKEDFFITSLKDQRNELQSALAKEEKRRITMEKEITELQSHLSSLRAGPGGISELNNKLEMTRKEQERLQDQNLRLTEDLRKSESLYDDEKKVIAELRVALESDKRLNHELRNEIEVLKESVRSANREVDYTKQDNIKLQNDVKGVLQEKNGENSRIKEILKEYELKIQGEIEEKHLITNEKFREINRLNDIISELQLQLERELDDKQRLNVYHNNEINKFIERAHDYEAKINSEIEDKEKLHLHAQRNTSQINDLENRLAIMERELIEERSKNRTLGDHINHEREKSARLEDELEREKEKVAEAGLRINKHTYENTRAKNEYDDRITESNIKYENIRSGFDDLKYENQDLINKINANRNEFDMLKHEIISWKEIVNKRTDENTELKKIIEDLEVKNRKLVETLNLHLYNRAAEFKERTLQALKNSESPSRLQKVLSSGYKFRDRTEPSPNRLAQVLQDEDKKSFPSKMADIQNMVKFEQDTVRNIKQSHDGNPLFTTPQGQRAKAVFGLSSGPGQFDASYLTQKADYHIENDPKEVKSNFALIKTMDEYAKTDPESQSKTLKIQMGEHDLQADDPKYKHDSPSRHTMRRSQAPMTAEPYKEEREVLAKSQQSLFSTPSKTRGVTHDDKSRGLNREDLDESKREQHARGQQIADRHHKVTKSAGRLLNILGINSPIRKQKASEHLSPSTEQKEEMAKSSLVYSRSQLGLNETMQGPNELEGGRGRGGYQYEEGKDDDDNRTFIEKPSMAATSLATSMVRSSLNDLKSQLNQAQRNKADLEQRMLQYERRLHDKQHH